MKLPRLIWVDENDEPISLRSWLRARFSKPPPPPEPGTVAWIAAQDAARLRGKIAAHLARKSPAQTMIEGGIFKDEP